MRFDIRDVLAIANNPGLWKLKGLIPMLYEYFDNHKYDDEYLSFLVALSSPFDDYVSAIERAREMYIATGSIEALIIWANSSYDLIRSYEIETLDALLLNVPKADKKELRSALHIAICYYYENVNSYEYVYHLNQSIEHFPNPEAYLRLAEYEKKMGNGEVAWKYLSKSMDLLKFVYTRSFSSHMKQTAPGSYVTFAAFCDRNIFWHELSMEQFSMRYMEILLPKKGSL